MSGLGVFVMEISDFRIYAEALRIKVICEITPDTIGHAD
jgi:hypothetical protein